VRIGIFLGRATAIDDIVAGAGQIAADGLAGVWLPQMFGLDALTVAAIVGREVPGIELGTAVVPTYPRHPIVMAQQALTVQAAAGGRFALGIGLSHEMVISGMFGYSFERPARHLREYLSVLLPLVRDGSVSFTGETVKAQAGVEVPGAMTPPVLVAALGPRMLRLAGSMADGTITWMVGPATLESHTVPLLRAAAVDAGRPPPRVVVGLPVCVTDDAAAARERAARIFSIYGTLPSYRAMLDREGAEGPADVAIAGDEAAVTAAVEHLGAVGATDLLANEFGSREERQRTRALLKGLVAEKS
jgi:5,10-methylenetetrahydromethanopterin reductase